MKDNEIIKALEEELKTALIINHRFEESNDTENPEDHKFIALLVDTIDLIKRQQAEIERLHEEGEGYKAELVSEHLSRMDNIRELQAEIERLTERLDHSIGIDKTGSNWFPFD